MTTRESQRYLDRQGWVRLNGLNLRLTCTDVKTRWGQTRFLMSVPHELGSGHVWFNRESVKFQTEEK